MRCGALAAMLGGLLWVAVLLETSLRPADPMRGPSPLLFAALLLIALGLIGVYTTQRAPLVRLGRATGCLAAGSVVFLLAARVLVDVRVAPALLFAVAVGAFLGALLAFFGATLRARVISPVTTGALLITTVSLAFFNFGDSRIWLGVLFGLAWLGVGWAMWARSGVGDVPSA